jgi:8-oxo-dGTP pyrophosphatase MutT (NUDIX family)
MTTLLERFAAWMAEHDADNPATPAATVLALRDSRDGPEILMVQRNAKGSFASNWVFPGGKVDPEDFDGDDDIVLASRRAASREAVEEADLVVDEGQLVPFSHWMPPLMVPRRFATWFYATEAPAGADGDVTIDGSEIVDHLWVTPSEALERHREGEVELVPPTWVTLHHLSHFSTSTTALAAIERRPPPFYVTRLIPGEAPTVCWHGDAAYETGDLDAPGGRHRLTMTPGRWTFEEPHPWVE